MVIVQPIESADTLDKCRNHKNNNIKLITLQKGIKAINQIYCVICLEAKSITTQTLTWDDAKQKVQQSCQERQSQFENSVKSIIEQMEAFSKIIGQIKKSFNLSFDQINSSITSWLETIRQEIVLGSKYSLYDQLEVLINSENIQNYFQRQENIKKCNQKVLEVLQEEFTKLQPSKELQQLQETIIKIEVFMKQGIKDKFSDQENQKMTIINCECPQHKNEQITMINVNEGVKRELRTLCNECKLTNVIPLQKFEQDWKKYSNKLEQQREERQSQLQQSVVKQKQQLKKLQIDFSKEIQKINCLIDTQMKNWVLFIKKQKNFQLGKVDVIQLQQMAEILSQDRGNNISKDEKEVEELNNQLTTNVFNCLKQLSNILNVKIEDIKIKKQEIPKEIPIRFEEEKIDLSSRKLPLPEKYEIPNLKEEIKPVEIKSAAPIQQMKVKASTFQLISTTQQPEKCYSIAFNQNGTIMAAGSDKEIKIWEFANGRLKDSNILLEGHTAWVYSLVFSKKVNWFASASEDRTIICWQQTSPKVWVSSQPQGIHTSSVISLLLSNLETQLISCSQDKTIKVWLVNCAKNELKFEYSLERHTQSVYCISYNTSQTQIVSCSLDKQIIVWTLGKQKRWEFNQVITKSEDDYGFRVCFINDNIITWQQQSKGIVHFFESKKGTFVERPDLRLQLRAAGFDNRLFPSTYNHQKQILIQKHNQYVYIIRLQKNGKYQIESQPIDEDSQYNYGGITENGEYLIIKNDSKKQLKVYQIQLAEM